MKKAFVAAMLAVSLAACGPQVPPVPQVTPDGVVQQAQQEASNGPGWLGAAAAGVGGYLLGKNAGRNQAYGQGTTIIQQRPIIVQQPRYTAPVPRTYSPSRSYSSPTRSYSSPSPSRSVTRRR